MNPTPSAPDAWSTQGPYDVIVIGAGMVGLYAVYRFIGQGLSVLCLESASGVGGVWRHNWYPGARVDIESLDYCYLFSPELFREWKWSERYAGQPELERYLNHVADRFDLRQHILFDHAVTAARRLFSANLWQAGTALGKSFTSRFLVTAMGNPTAPRQPDFPGLGDFQGEWVQAARWPRRPVEVKGKRIGGIGTDASGVQVIPPLAAKGEHLTVFQRTPSFVGWSRNHPLDPAEIDAAADRFEEYRREIFTCATATHLPKSSGSFAQLDEVQRVRALEDRFQYGHCINSAFDEAQFDWEVNEVISDFMRKMTRAVIRDPATADKLIPYDVGIGNRRLGMSDDYYET